MRVFFVKRYSRKVKGLWQVIFLACAKSDIAPLVQLWNIRAKTAAVAIKQFNRARCNSFNAISPLPFGLSPIAQISIISLLKQTSFARGELGTRIDEYRSLIMPLVHR